MLSMLQKVFWFAACLSFIPWLIRGGYICTALHYYSNCSVVTLSHQCTIFWDVTLLHWCLSFFSTSQMYCTVLVSRHCLAMCVENCKGETAFNATRPELLCTTDCARLCAISLRADTWLQKLPPLTGKSKSIAIALVRSCIKLCLLLTLTQRG